MSALDQSDFDADTILDRSLLNNLRAKTIKERKERLNASASLMRSLQARANKGELTYVALYSNAIDGASTIKEATANALADVKRPLPSQVVHSNKKQLPQQGTRMLMAVVWTTTAALDKGKRFPELASIDATCKTNDEERPFVKVTGVDGDGTLFSRASALLWDESEEAFMFLLNTALPALWGRETCVAISAIISDGDPHECRCNRPGYSAGMFYECGAACLFLACRTSKLHKAFWKWRGV